MNCKILKKHSLNQEITEFILEKPWDFAAGQYTAIIFNGNPFYFSIASSPLASQLELHIQNSLAHPLRPDFADFLLKTNSVELLVPQGKAVLTDNHRPLLLIAGGSGFAPMKSIIETVHKTDKQREIYLYWGVRRIESFYHQNLITQWQKNLMLKFAPVLSEQQHPDYRYGLVTEAVLEDFKNLHSFHIYLAGPFPMSYIARESFTRKGADPLYLFSDAFEFG